MFMDKAMLTGHQVNIVVELWWQVILIDLETIEEQAESWTVFRRFHVLAARDLLGLARWYGFVRL